MTRTIATKVMWVGRATVFTIGLAVTLALMLGVATAALAAVPGDPFKLGELNAVNVTSTLAGNVNGAMLGIENKSPGSRAAPAPALSLKVAPNNPPLTANAAAGTATGLSADELDGLDQGAFLRANGKAKAASNADFATFAGEAQNAQFAADANNLDGRDASGFANGTNGKANDADKLDGKDSTAFVNSTFGTAPNAQHLDGQDSTRFFSGKTYIVTNKIVDDGPNGLGDVRATCDQGDALLSGGFSGAVFSTTNTDYVNESRPLDSRTWLVTFQDTGLPNDTHTVFAVCADLFPLR